MIQKFQLANGLKVIMSPSHKSPVVTVQAWVKTGSADERVGEEGISHFIEHLLFKGTKKFKVGEIASLIEGSGGELNAYTSFDQTVFHITISKEFLATAVDALTEMMGHPSFDSTEIDNEREVVIEEIKRSTDSPQRIASQLLFRGVYKKHPYGKPVIGFEQNIRDFSRKAILDYYKGRYSPKNMRLVVAGDFEKTSTKKLIETTFGKIPTSAIRKTKRPAEQPQRDSRIEIEASAFQESLVHLAFRGPGAKHPDTPALDILALVLGQGDSSRLSNKVRIQKPLVNYVGSHVYSPQDEGFFAISAGLSLDNLTEFLTDLGEEILKLQVDLVEPQELQKAITIFEADEVFGVETVDGLARKLGSFELLFNSPEYYQTYFEKLLKVTSNDLIRVARKYLVPKNLTFAATVAGDTKIAQRAAAKFLHDLELAQDALRKVGPPTSKHKAQAKKPAKRKPTNKEEIVKVGLAKGGNLIVAPNSQAPAITVKIAFRGGQRIEPEGQEGITDFLSNVWLAGTSNRTETQILEDLDNTASAISPFAGRNTAGLSLSALAHGFENTSRIFFDLLREPAFLQDSIERERVMMLEALKQRNDNPSMVAIQKFHSLVFEGHPYAKDTQGTEDSIRSISRDNIRDHWHKMTCRANATIVAAGEISVQEISGLVEGELGRLRHGHAISDTFAVSPIKEEKRHFEPLKKEQSNIIYGMRGVSLFDSDRYTLQVLQSILAGQGGRLFLELRDKASLAYSVSPLHTEGIEVGYFAAYIGCSPEKGTKALEMLDLEFKKLAETRVSEAELGRAKRYLSGRHDIGLQRNSAIASAILFEEVYGQPYSNVFDYSSTIARVSANDIQSLAQKLYSEKKIIVAVGPTCPW